MADIEKIQIVIIDCLKGDRDEANGGGDDEKYTPATRLYGDKGILDSLGLVSLVVAVERQIQNDFGKKIILANERAMSQKKSPFRDVRNMAEYIEMLLSEV